MAILRNLGAILGSILTGRTTENDVSTPTTDTDDSITIERRHQQRHVDDAFIANLFIGQRCIFVPNEWDDPIIGRLEHVDLARGIVCHVLDYVTNEPFIFIGWPMHYNPQRLSALLKLDPFERYSLCRTNPQISSPLEKPKMKTVLTAYEIMKRLDENGFFKEDHHDA